MPIDPVTGQEYFRPLTGRAPKTAVSSTQRNPDLSIGEHLYRQKDRIEETWSEAPVPTPPLSRTKSESILKRRKEDCYQRLYFLMKPEGESLLTGVNLRLEMIAEDTVTLLKPLLEELLALDEGLALNDFSAAMDNLMERLTPEERAQLLGFGKKPIPQPMPSFKPEITKAGQLTERQGGLYERETARRRALEAQRKAMRDARESEQTAECTFRPKVTKYVPKRS